jgi:hypothetical protein
LNAERIVDGGLNGQEALRCLGRFKTLHLPLASSHRKMRILGSVILPHALLVATRQAQLRLWRMLRIAAGYDRLAGNVDDRCALGSIMFQKAEVQPASLPDAHTGLLPSKPGRK